MTSVTLKKEKSQYQILCERNGYVWDEELQMPEHRAVATRLLHRDLDTSEQIHHCNHHRDDNDPSNLFVVTVVVHDLIHIATLISPFGRDWPCGSQLMKPEVLAALLKAEGIPHIWLKNYSA